MKGTRVIIRGAPQREYAAQLVAHAPLGAILHIHEATRSREQNAKMWAMLTDVMRAKPQGRRWTKETWKCAFMDSLGWEQEFAFALDDERPFPCGYRSSHLSVREMSDLIEVISEYGSRHGVEWKETQRGGHA